MPYTGNPSASQTDELRLLLGDTYSDMEILSDAEYTYYITKYGSVRRASQPAAMAILFKLSKWTRERTGDIEVYGADWANNFRKALELWVRNPEFTTAIAMPYAGGISKQDMRANDSSSDTVRPFAYEGMTNEEHVYDEEGKALDDF